jgi:hypothetical protein
MSGMHPLKSWLLSCKTRNRIAAKQVPCTPNHAKVGTALGREIQFKGRTFGAGTERLRGVEVPGREVLERYSIRQICRLGFSRQAQQGIGDNTILRRRLRDQKLCFFRCRAFAKVKQVAM